MYSLSFPCPVSLLRDMCDPDSVLMTSGASASHKELPDGAQLGLKGIIALWEGFLGNLTVIALLFAVIP